MDDRQLFSPQVTSSDALGDLVHRFPPGPNHMLAEEAKLIQLDHQSGGRIDLGFVWNRLTEGQWRISRCFSTDTRLYMVLSFQRGARPAGELDLLHRTLLGERQKALALDIEMSPSTVTTRLSASLNRMGFTSKPGRVPILLVAAALASKRPGFSLGGRLTQVTFNANEGALVSIARPDSGLRDVLTPAECSVARLIVDGLSHREIADRRGTAITTIANQVGSLFRKLGISGRNELLVRIVKDHSEWQILTTR